MSQHDSISVITVLINFSLLKLRIRLNKNHGLCGSFGKSFNTNTYVCIENNFSLFFSLYEFSMNLETRILNKHAMHPKFRFLSLYVNIWPQIEQYESVITRRSSVIRFFCRILFKIQKERIWYVPHMYHTCTTHVRQMCNRIKKLYKNIKKNKIRNFSHEKEKLNIL